MRKMAEGSEATYKRRHTRGGFTLLEVIIVLTLVTVILGLTTVYFAGLLPAAKLDATGRELSALIRHTRTLARAQGADLTVVINLDDRTYGVAEKIPRDIPDNVLMYVDDPGAGEIRQGKYSLIFHRAGNIEGGAIVLSGGKKRLRIESDPITGAVLIRNGR
jgi:general secretion pathway protein H